MNKAKIGTWYVSVLFPRPVIVLSISAKGILVRRKGEGKTFTIPSKVFTEEYSKLIS